jgi:Stage II sporulation protein E (SpoIIE)
MSLLESAPLEWYILESVTTESSPLEERAMQLGPFATEAECRSMLDDIQRMPKFNRSPLAVHKRIRRRDKRIKVELQVYVRRSGTDEKSRYMHTVDASKSGARLAGCTELMRIGEVLDIRCGDQEAPFHVVWVGSPGAAAEGQVGVESLTPEVNIWGLDLSQETEEQLRPNELAVACAVQTRLLPQEQVQLRTLDYRGHCIQARTVGGDYYDFLDMGAGSVGLVLADIAGKGVSAALLMANLQGALRTEARIGTQDLPEVLASVNRHFHEHTDANRYATLFFAIYDDATRKLRYVNCGHNPALLLHKRRVERLTATATVLGLFRDWECSVAEVQMEAGDILCIYTDGITEATDKNGKEFGESGLLEVLHESRNLESASILQKVEHAMAQFRSGEQEDDVTLVIACAR